jgi:hypothetical protein
MQRLKVSAGSQHLQRLETVMSEFNAVMGESSKRLI